MTKKLKLDPKYFNELTFSRNYFGSLAQSIIHQQLSRKAALKIEQKFLKLFKPRKNKFPKPQEVLEISDVEFRDVGLSRQKINYLRDLASKFLDGTIKSKEIPIMTDEEVVEHLTRVKGIGTWTAQMFLIFALKRENILPIGDLAIKKGFQQIFKLKSLPSEEKMLKLARPYDGKYTILSLYLWDILDK